MTLKRKSLVLAKLAEDSRSQLRAMVAELSGEKSATEGDPNKLQQWNRRFAASGKIRPAAPIRPL